MTMYDIEQIKQRNPIEEVISRHGVVLLRKGARFAGRCPFHDDDYPSLVVYPQTRSFFCFGCGASGDVIDFVQRADGVGFRAALERLSNEASEPETKQGPAPTLSVDDRMILTAASVVYHETLLKTPAAIKYLESRGIGLPLARRCRLGFSDGRSLRQYLQRRRLSLRRATKMGLLWRDGGETMAGRLVIPELRGDQCLWMSGRALDDGREPKYRGLSLPKPLLGYEHVRGRSRIFVTEGPFDYLTGVGWSLPICALQGTRVQAEKLGFLQRARTVLIVFDNDDPGRAAAAELSGRLGQRAHVVCLPEGIKDLNDLGRASDGRALFFRLLEQLKGEDSDAT